MVEALLLQHGYTKAHNRKFGVHVTQKKSVYFTQLVIGKTIYDTDMKVDFYVYSPKLHKRGLIIECKWQQSGGSVDEKYPYLVKNLLKSKEVSIIVLDGGGYKAGARTWLIGQANKHNKLSVYSLSSFTRWANGGGL